MKVYRSIADFQKGDNPVATIGTFDGVHLGHRKILGRLTQLAKEMQGESVVISFHPHPRLVLFPEDNPLRLLTTIEEKIAKLSEAGIDKVLLIPFTREFSRLSSEDFIRDILVEAIGIRKIIIGYDHHFGRNRTGGLKDLEAGAGKWGFEVEEIPAHQVDDANVSSTKIRKALLEGDMEQARRFLGYSYPLSGHVIHGDSMGRELGFPTANLRLHDPVKLVPEDGVYIVRLTAPSSLAGKWGLMSIGSRPTLEGKSRAVEVYVMDYSADLYGQDLAVECVERIRGQEKFPDLDALVLQMKKDEAYAREKIRAQHA